MEMDYRDREESSSLDLFYLDMVWMNGHLGLAKTSLLVYKSGLQFTTYSFRPNLKYVQRLL